MTRIQPLLASGTAETAVCKLGGYITSSRRWGGCEQYSENKRRNPHRPWQIGQIHLTNREIDRMLVCIWRDTNFRSRSPATWAALPRRSAPTRPLVGTRR